MTDHSKSSFDPTKYAEEFVAEAKSFYDARKRQLSKVYARWTSVPNLRRQCAHLAAERDLEHMLRTRSPSTVDIELDSAPPLVEELPPPAVKEYFAVIVGGNLYFKEYVNASGKLGWSFTSSLQEACRERSAKDLMNTLHHRGATVVHHWQIERGLPGQLSEVIGIYPPLQE